MGFESIYRLSVIMQMVDHLSQPSKIAKNNFNASLSSMEKMNQGFGNMVQTGAIMTGLGQEITAGVLEPVKATFDTKRALGELSAMGVQDLETLGTAAKDFSSIWAGTTKAEFLSAAVDIKGGIDSLNEEGIAKYTELSGVTAKATGSTIAEMTSLFATGYGIYKDYYDDLSDIQFGETFSAGLAQAILTFKASGSSMAQSITALGGSATTANVPLEEQLSVLGMLQATMSGSEAGTKYRAFIRTAAKAGDELGLSFLDANDQLKSMPEILGTLKAKYGDTLDAIEKQQIQTAFGSDEAVALIDLMYPKIGALQDNILTLYDSMGQGSSVTRKMADAINETEPERFERLTQRVQNVKESIGNSLLPTINDLMGKGEQLLTKVDSWVAKNQELVKVIMIIALALGGFLTVAGTAITLIGGVGMIFVRTATMIGGFGRALIGLPGHLDTLYIKALYAKDGILKVGSGVLTFGKQLTVGGAQAVKGFAMGLTSMAKQAIMTAATALPGLISGVWSFTAALLANPITWVVIAIVALIAAIILLWNKCEWFRNGVKAIFSFLKEGVTGALQTARSAFSGIGSVIGNVMTAAKDTVKEKLDNMKQAYVTHGGGIKGVAAAAIEGVKGYYTAGFTFIDNLTGGKLSEITDKFGGGIQNVKNKISESISWFKESGKKIITTFTDGIKSAINKPVEAVQGGLQKIRNMLPFSDAKTGPLSQLTLSGKKVMTTFAGGIGQETNLPSETVSKAFEQMNFDVSVKAPEINKEDIATTGDTKESAKAVTKRTTIEHLNLNVDLKSIKDLKKLLKLLEEIEDYTNSNGPDTEPEPQLT